jgi:hypothetical protein
MTTSEDPVVRRERLLRAHDEMLTAAANCLQGVRVTVEGKPAQITVLALVARIIQIGCALQELMERGYGDEAAPLARSMLTGVANVVAIVDGEPDGRALSYQLHAETFERKLIDRAEKYEIFDPERAKAEREDTERKFKQARAMFEGFGVVRAQLGESDRYWHGLNTERDLFAKMGMLPQYELEYAWLSDEVHVNIGAISRELTDAFDEKLGFGPRGNVPDIVLMASSDAIPEALAQLSNLLGLNKRDEAQAIKDRFKAELFKKD